MSIEMSKEKKTVLAYLISILGAAGVGIQNSIAVYLFLKGVSKVLAFALGGVCSGMVNFFINVELLEGFLERITSNKSNKPLNGWRKFRYYAGSFVFIVTGVLFGLTAFTIGMATPLSVLALASGLFVALIMTIQEVETWLQSFDDPMLKEKESLKEIFWEWKSTLTFKKVCGHIIAAGNVIALSVLFTLGLAEVLVALQVAALPALIIGLSVSFTFGAFTEFYFYNFFLAKFCEKIQEKYQAMKKSQYAPLGYLCIGTNAIVNAVLTYSGVALLSGLLVAAGFAVPPVGLMMALGGVSAFFGGSASLLLGMDFWIRKMSKQKSAANAKVLLVVEAVELLVTPQSVANHKSINRPVNPYVKPGLLMFLEPATPVVRSSQQVAPIPN